MVKLLSVVIGVLTVCLARVDGSIGFRFGSIYWSSVGNDVNFTIQASFLQPVESVSVGGLIQLSGVESPQFYFGDNELVQPIRLKVLSLSIEEEWFMGEIYLTHHYSAPVAPDGRPWKAQFTGCCRPTDLQNNGGKPFVLSADVDLNRAVKSPMSRILPIITVPWTPVQSPKIRLVSDEMDQVEWSLGAPFDVGGSLRFTPSMSTGSYLKVNIGSIFDDAQDPSLDCSVTSSARGCLFRLLQARSDMYALTIEGWIKPITSDFKYILASRMANSTACGGACSIPSIFVGLDGERVMVGHQESEGVPNVTVSFPVCDVAGLCAQLDSQYGANAGGPLVGRWVHLAVVRTQEVVPATVCGALYAVKYAVLLNSMLLGTSDSLCPPLSKGSPDDVLLLGSGQASGGPGSLQGFLQEWRFWNGAVPPTQLAELMLMPLRPSREAMLGDPTVGQVTAFNYVSSNVILADFAMEAPCPEPCSPPLLLPVYPRPADLRLAALVVGNVTAAGPGESGAMLWRSAVDDVGLMAAGQLAIKADQPGLYQVSVFVGYRGGAGRAGVDLLVQAVASAWDPNASAYRLAAPLPGGPALLPTLVVSAGVLAGCAAGTGGGCAREYAGNPDGPWREDLTACLPGACRLRLLAGFPAAIRFEVRDGTAGASWRVGLGLGAVPEGAWVAAVGPRTWDLRWIPCPGRPALAAVCLEPLVISAGARALAGPMTCLQVELASDAPPWVRVEPAAPPPMVMGRLGRLVVAAGDGNCLQTLRLTAQGLPDGMTLQPAAAAAGDGCNGVRGVAEWRPDFRQGGGRHRLCFTAHELPPVPDPASPPPACPAPLQEGTGCVWVWVERCRFALGAEQELQQLAAGLGTDWMRLWSLNSHLLHPDYLLLPDDLLWLGHLYRAAGGELPAALAQRMGMTPTALGLLNRDMDPAAPLAPGQLVCVLPDSCKGAAASAYSPALFADPAFLARALGGPPP